MKDVSLVCFDMAGTTVRDVGEVRQCFQAAASETGLSVPAGKLLALMGRSKRQVFDILWTEELGADHAEVTSRIDASYAAFRRILENHYETTLIEPSNGCLECFDWLRSGGVGFCLTTGFYRRVTDIILRRLGWEAILSIASDEVPKGRPAPYLIHRGMALTGAEDVRKVVTIGDTPSDLHAGRNAGCGWTVGITSGTHSREQLAEIPNDCLIHTLAELKDLLS
jgi:phosphonatase-like hydrolase